MFGGLCSERNLYRSLSGWISYLHAQKFGGGALGRALYSLRLATTGGQE